MLTMQTIETGYEMEDQSYLTEHSDAVQSSEAFEYVVNISVQTNVAVTQKTTDTSKPDDVPEREIQDYQQFQELINNRDSQVSVYPMLLTVTGFPQCGKTTTITDGLNLKKESDDFFFSHHEVVASGFKRSKKIRSVSVTRDHSFKFGMQAGLTSNFKTLSFGEEMGNNSTFTDKCLKDEIVGLAKFIQELDQLLKEYQHKRVRNSADRDHIKKIINLEASLRHGIGFVNIWDISINKSVRPFLEIMGSCLSKTHMWLFINLEQDVSQLHLPTDIGNDDSSKLQWRSRIQYLLRMCKMCKQTTSRDGFKKFCTIFAVHTSSFSNVKTELEKLQMEIDNAALQMGVHELINFEIKTVCIDRLNKKKLCRTFKGTLSHLEEQDIPLSWLLLRSSFLKHKTFYLTHNELQSKAAECRIDSTQLEKFCEFFTSFGSIFDTRKINEQSEYIVIKPRDFLTNLETLFSQTSNGNRVITTGDNDENSVILRVLADVSLALRQDHLGPLNTGLATYYFPSPDNTMKPKLKGTPGALQLVRSTESPKITMSIEVTKRLLSMQPFPTSAACTISLRLNTEFTNCVDIVVDGDITATITLTFQGDITEITLETTQQEHLKELCLAIVKAIQQMLNDKSKYLDGIRYHFAISCASDPLKNYVAFNAYRKRHILPNYTLCDECKSTYNESRAEIKAWNVAIEESPIPKEMKLNGDLSAEDVAMLAAEVAKYPWEAICMFAKELSVKIFLDEPKEKKMWLILGMLMEWEGKRRKDDQSSRKVLAGLLLKLAEQWKEQERKTTEDDKTLQPPDFKKLARKLDIQVMSEDQMQKIQKQYEERESMQSS